MENFPTGPRQLLHSLVTCSKLSAGSSRNCMEFDLDTICFPTVGSSRVLITTRVFIFQWYEGSRLCPAVLLLSVQIHVCYCRFLRQYVRVHVLLLYDVSSPYPATEGSIPCPAAVCSIPYPAMFEVNVLLLQVRV